MNKGSINICIIVVKTVMQSIIKISILKTKKSQARIKKNNNLTNSNILHSWSTNWWLEKLWTSNITSTLLDTGTYRGIGTHIIHLYMYIYLFNNRLIYFIKC